MAIPHYVNENESDMRRIKPGWYRMDDDGSFSSGLFPSHEECVRRIAKPTLGTSYPSEIAPCNTEAATAMDEIRRLISQFENAVRQYDSCQPHATDKWRADLVRHRKWDLQIIAELQRRFAPLSRKQSRRNSP